MNWKCFMMFMTITFSLKGHYCHCHFHFLKILNCFCTFHISIIPIQLQLNIKCLVFWIRFGSGRTKKRWNDEIVIVFMTATFKLIIETEMVVFYYFCFNSKFCLSWLPDPVVQHRWTQLNYICCGLNSILCKITFNKKRVRLSLSRDINKVSGFHAISY